jgi:hypothetical protein
MARRLLSDSIPPNQPGRVANRTSHVEEWVVAHPLLSPCLKRSVD